jgi:hypothetical protein
MPEKIMLFRHPGQYKFNGEWFDFVLVNKKELQDYKNKGWYQTKLEAKKHSTLPPEEVDRKIKYSELTGDQIKEIETAIGTYKELRERFNVSLYAIRKIRGGL